MENVAFHSFTQMKDDYNTNSHYLTYTCLFRKVRRMYFLNLGVKRLNELEDELWKLHLNSAFCAITTDSDPRCPRRIFTISTTLDPFVLQAVYYSVGGHYHGHYDSHTRRAQRPCCGRSTMTQCRVCRCVYSTRFRVAHANSYRILTDHTTFLTDHVPTT